MVNLKIEKPFIRFLNQNLARRIAKFVFKLFVRTVEMILNIFFWKELEHITSGERADFVLQRGNFIWAGAFFFFFGGSCWMKNGWRAIHFAQILFVRIWGLIRVSKFLFERRKIGRACKRENMKNETR